MKRFIRYLYEYEQGKRMRNVGFVKVEQDSDESIVHIHGKGLRLTGMDSLKVSLFYREGTDTFGICQGDIAYMGPALNYRLRYTGEDTGYPENYNAICGLLLESSSGRRFAAVWDDTPAEVDNIRPFDERRRQADETETISEEEPEVETVPEEEPEADIDAAENHGEVIRIEPEAETGAGMGIRTGMRTSGRSMPEREEEPDTEEEEETGREGEEGPDREEPVCPWQVRKIHRREISALPRCEWRLANNNFLVHGYINYRHLVLLDDGRILKIGVPGIYHEREAEVARNMGFPEFIEASRTKLALTAEECDEGQQFGYWCRQVRRPPM